MSRMSEDAGKASIGSATAMPVADGRVRLTCDGPFESLSVRTADGRWVRMHSQRDPAGEADRLVAPAFLEGREPAVLLVIGLGLGYALEAIDRRSSRTRVIGLEPISQSALLLGARALPKSWIASGRLSLLAGPDYSGAAEACRAIAAGQPSPEIVVHPVIAREFPEDAARARAVAESIVAGARANDEARRRFAGLYLLNTLANVPVIAREADAGSLDGIFPGIPACVVAAGPSLDRNLEHLRELQDRMVLIAVDTAARPLLNAGIRPHMVVGVDPQDANARHLMGLGDTGGLWLVAEPSLQPAVFPAFAGRTFCFKVSDHHPWPWLRSHGLDRATLRAWGSVVTTAFDVAIRAGCDPIVFAGADMAYTRGLTYCRHTTYEPDWAHLPTDAERAAALAAYVGERATVSVEDVHNRPVRTTPAFLQFRNWLVSRAGELEGRQVLNATGDGILHGPGIAQVSFSQFAPPPLPGHGETRRETLVAAWRRGRSELGAGVEIPPTLVEHVIRLLEASRPDELPEPLAAWGEFTFSAVTAGECLAAVYRILPDSPRQRAAGILQARLNRNPRDGHLRHVWSAVREDRATRPAASSSVARRSVARWEPPQGWRGQQAEPRETPGGLLATTACETDADATREFRSAWHVHFNARRLEHLASLGLDLHGKTVLDAGAGVGDLSTFFTDRECAVLVTDARPENVRDAQARFACHPHVRVSELCLDPPPAEPVGSFDIVFCYGVLHHVSDPALALDYLAACTAGLLLLETAVHNEPHDDPIAKTLDPRVRTGSVAGVLNRPSRRWLHAALRRLFPYVYVPLAQPAHAAYPTDWTRPVSANARAVFVASNTPLPCPALGGSLPVRQRRH